MTLLKRVVLSCSVVIIMATVSCWGNATRAQTPLAGKYALVLGNSSYQHVNKLPNPAYDAKAVGESFERLGFKVTTAEDLGYDEMRRAILQFGRDARGADMAVIYFAGHGIELGGEDWLIPIDADLQTDLDVDTAAINLKSLMKAVSETQNLGLIILDACRTNPFRLRSPTEGRAAEPLERGIVMPNRGDRGLAPLDPSDSGLAAVDPVNNVLVAFAARDGTVAEDGLGSHSPFTSALLTHLETKGLEINFLFRNIRDDVLAATKNQQEPFTYGSLSKDAIYLNSAPVAQGEGPPIGGDEIAWAFLNGSQDVESLQRFVTTFPQSAHAGEAQARIALLLNPHPFLATLVVPDSITTRTELAPQTIAVGTDVKPEELARKFTHDSTAVDMAWDVIKATKDQKTIEHFVNAFPTSPRRATVHPKVTGSARRQLVIPRSIDIDRQQAIVSSDVPWDKAPEATGNQLVDVFSTDYTTREDRRARACDRLAADPNDVSRSPGVEGATFDRMDGGAALYACRAAVNAFPDVARYRYQLCRAYSKIGRYKDASNECQAAIQEAAAVGPPPAAYNFTFENISNIQSLGPSAGVGKGPGNDVLVPRPNAIPLKNAAGSVGVRVNQSVNVLSNALSKGGPKGQGDGKILQRVKSALTSSNGGRAALNAANSGNGGQDNVPALRAAARRFAASARALRAGAQIARTEGKPLITQNLAREAMAARALAHRTIVAVRIAAPRVALPGPGLIKIKAPRIVMPKIIIPHIMIKRP